MPEKITNSLTVTLAARLARYLRPRPEKPVREHVPHVDVPEYLRSDIGLTPQVRRRTVDPPKIDPYKLLL